MNALEYNPETGDHHRPVERKITLGLGNGFHHWSLWYTRYVADALQHDDWMAIAGRLRTHKAHLVRRAVLLGDYFTTEGQQALRAAVEDALRRIVWEQFRTVQQGRGSEAYQVDPFLCGEEYRI